MWRPKYKDNSMFVGKMARIYYNDGNHKDTEYVEGELVYILNCEYNKNIYSVQILDNVNKFTKHTCTSDIIKKVEVEMFEIDDNVNYLCEKYLTQDLNGIINQYVDNYFQI